MIITKKEARENAREYALRQIRENIENLQLKPGSAVSENELAKELGISRTPVREALQELHKNKMIEVYPQKGIIISHIDFEVVNEMVFLRRVLEKAVVEELCDNISQENILELEKNIQLQEFYLDKQLPQKILELDNEFHRSLFVMSHKERIYHLMEATQGHFNRIRTMSVFSVKELKIIEDHKAIVGAIKSKDKVLAGEIILSHLSRYKLDQNEIMEKYPEYFK
ncbi:MAG TPA: GntR family transcriptional regulator [Mobilitalea sp.]|nr:GntR family transcriptional regulator [Mobilitalea sp.]